MKKILLVIIFWLFLVDVYSINYMTTATSISWSGAYTSIAEGFESMLYNPAGLYMTNRRFGLNIFGSYAFRFYNNTFSTDHILNLFNSSDGDITGFIANRLNAMTNMGFDTGIDLSLFNFMFYIRYEKFSFGFSFLPKTYLKFTINKNLFEALGQKIDLTSPLDVKFSSSFLQYLDLNFNLSTRAKFIEKVIPVEAIYVGMTGHFYFPTILVNAKASGLIKSGIANDTGISTFDLGVTGELNLGGLVPHILNLANLNSSALGIIPQNMSGTLDEIIKKSQSTGFGLGLDMGFVVKFNKIFKLGVSLTDIGFISIPQSTNISISLTKNIDPMNINSFTDSITSDLMNSLGNISNANPFFYMMPLAIRCGVALSPPPNKYFDILVALDLSVSDLNRAVNQEYPAFNFATGVEFTPKVFWVLFPLRVAFNYNSEANAPSFSFGSGLYLGPVEMEIGIKGLEVLFVGLGTKEVVLGFDFKFEF